MRRPVLAALAVTALLAGPLAMTASAQPAVTAPVVHVSPGYYPLGSTIDDQPYGDGSTEASWLVQFDWSVTNTPGVCKQTITEQSYNEMGGTYPVDQSERSRIFYLNTDDFLRGGIAIKLHVSDCYGHTTTTSYSYGPGQQTEDYRKELHYTGSWAVAHSKAFDMNSTHYTTTKGDSVTENVYGPNIALVMEKAPDRGSASVYVDGVSQGTVDTYSASKVHKTVVWEKSFSQGAHTLKVVNQATPGHPRIDLDLTAFVDPYYYTR